MFYEENESCCYKTRFGNFSGRVELSFFVFSVIGD